MSRAQWGHGYFTGKADAENELPGYVGLFFHTIADDGSLQYQGRIDKDLGDGRYLATLFSWLDGGANGTIVIDDPRSLPYVYADAYQMRKHAAYLAAVDMQSKHEDQPELARGYWDYFHNFDRYEEQLSGLPSRSRSTRRKHVV